MSSAREMAEGALDEAKSLDRYAPSRLVLAKLVVATEALLAATAPQEETQICSFCQRGDPCPDAAAPPRPAPDAVAEDEVETARAMLGLTVRMAAAKHACRDTTCRNLLTAALNMLLTLDARRRG